MKAFILRKKTSKAGKIYFVSPYGHIDLLGFPNEAGDIEVSYCEREVRPGTAPYAGAPARPQTQAAPKIVPRQGPPKIIPRDGPHHRAQQIPQDYVDHTKPSDLYEDGDPGFDESQAPF